MPRTKMILLATAVALVASCGPASQSAGRPAGQDVLTDKDLAEYIDVSLLDAVERLRPNWVRPQGAVSVSGIAPVVVVVNNVRVGGIEFLDGMPVEQVARVRFVDGTDAATRWGLNVDGGVIEVTTRTGRP